jgi:hypothetical protein
MSNVNPFIDKEFLKCIKRSYIIKQMIKEDRSYDITDFTIKMSNNIITMTLKLNNDTNIYKYQYIPKEKQATEIIKDKNNKTIKNLEKTFEKMIID